MPAIASDRQREEQGETSGTKTKNKYKCVCAQKLDMNSIKKVTKVGNG
jgi:hypothetical protein